MLDHLLDSESIFANDDEHIEDIIDANIIPDTMPLLSLERKSKNLEKNEPHTVEGVNSEKSIDS